MIDAGDQISWRPKGVVAVLDTSIHVRAWLSPRDRPNPSLRVMLLAGVVYDSLTGPAVLEEVEEVLVRPRFSGTAQAVRVWLDAFLRASHQVFPEAVPVDDPRAVGGDVDDLPILRTAYAALTARELVEVLASARTDGGWFIVSEDIHHFVPGQNVYGWEMITSRAFLRTLVRRGKAPSWSGPSAGQPPPATAFPLVSRWFVKKRATAQSVASSGAGELLVVRC